MASDNSEVLAAIAGIKESLATTNDQIGVALAQVSALDSMVSDLVTTVSQLQSANGQTTPDTTTVNEVIAVASAVESVASDVKLILDLVRNPPVNEESQGLA